MKGCLRSEKGFVWTRILFLEEAGSIHLEKSRTAEQEDDAPAVSSPTHQHEASCNSKHIVLERNSEAI